eukprot:2366753-Rhodomonas_salina.2
MVPMPAQMDAVELKTMSRDRALYGIGLILSEDRPWIVMEGTDMQDPSGQRVGMQVRVGDELLSVDDTSVDGLELGAIQRAILGEEKGSIVKLAFANASATTRREVFVQRFAPIKVWQELRQ